MKKLYSIMSCDDNGGIGFENLLPWPRNKTDMLWFRKATDMRCVIGSEKTFNSMPSELPNRIKVVSERGMENPDKLKEHLPTPAHVPFVIGGGEIFKTYMPIITSRFITIIHGSFEADTFMPLNEMIMDEEWDIDFFGCSINKEDNCSLLVQTRKGATKPHLLLEQVYNFFDPYYNLCAAESVSIKPGAHGKVKVKGLVVVPWDRTALVSISRTMGERGLYTTSQIFKARHRGEAYITVTNKSLDEIEIPKGKKFANMAFLLNR